mmetsp:Transcript_23241/g.72377  ORF Transcript_23241/g.72377 Transcript_23241/m.72377 type:complete len:468 (-) Transcript_23241:60-1463(-)
MADGHGALQCAAHAVLLLCLSLAAAAAGWKLRRLASQAGASPGAQALVDVYDEQRQGRTLGELFSTDRDRSRGGHGTLFENWSTSVAWYEPFRNLPFTPLLTCEPRTSLLMDRFDWQFVPDHAWVKPPDGMNAPKQLAGCRDLEHQPLKDNSHIANPRTVWAAAHTLPRLFDALAAAGLERGSAERVIVFSGNEMPMSRAFGNTQAEREATVARLRRYFGTIVYQVKDIELEHVRVAPMGLGWGYILILLGQWVVGEHPNNRTPRVLADHLADLEATMRLGLDSKDRGVLAVSGYVAGWLDDLRGTSIKVLDFAKRGRLYPPSNSSLKAVVHAAGSRSRMREWVTSPEAQAVGVEFRGIPIAEWWRELARYRFLVSPLGSAIQTSKAVEALVVLTVPIIERTIFRLYDELVELGFPMVVVGNWSEVTPEATARWWAQLAPKLERFRRNCLTVEGYWRMFTSRTGHCS